LQMTVASELSHELSHTVPQVLLMHTSTLPSYRVAPPTSRMLPYVQAVDGTLKESYIVNLHNVVPRPLPSFRHLRMIETILARSLYG